MTNDKLKTITARIRERREKLNYSQDYLAFKLEISQNTYSKIELNKVRLRLNDFLKICEVLEILPEDILAPK